MGTAVKEDFLAQDDYYYEIQLTNKQLVFYFMAGATGLILSFLAGVMVGRGVDAVGGEVQASRQLQEERVVAEEAPRPAPPAAENLTFAHRLEAEKVDESLEKPASGAGPGKGSAKAAARGPSPAPRVLATSIPGPTKPVASAAPVPAPSAPAGSISVAPPKPTPLPQTATGPFKPSPAPAGSPTFTIQVGAFKDKSGAESVASGLKSKGFAAYVDSGQQGLFNVRVGSFPARAEAETVLTRLRDEEKFKPFIVRN